MPFTQICTIIFVLLIDWRVGSGGQQFHFLTILLGEPTCLTSMDYFALAKCHSNRDVQWDIFPDQPIQIWEEELASHLSSARGEK